MICGTPRESGTLWDRIARALAPDGGEVNVSDWVQLQQALAHVSELTEQLDKEFSTLPDLAAHNHIYPETEERYAIKEELEEELSTGVVKLGGLLPQMERRVEHRRQNLERVRADGAKLNHPELQQDYSQAEEAARKQYMEALRYRDLMVVTLTKARSVLEAAQKKKFPGRKPGRQTPSGPSGPGPVQGSQRASNGASDRKKDGDETDGLISLGPLPGSTDTPH